MRRPKRVWKQDQQFALITLLPQFQNAVLRRAQLIVIVSQRRQRHGQLMRIGADGFKIVLVGEIGVRAAGKVRAQHVAHRLHHILLPQKAMPPPRAKVAHAQPRNPAQPFHLLPQPRLGPRIEDVQFELAQLLQAGPRLQLVDGRERIDLPQRRLRP